MERNGKKTESGTEIREEVIRKEAQEEHAQTIGTPEGINTEAVKKESLKLPMLLAGAFVYAFGVNLFLQPLHLYAGGLMGFAQLFRTLLADYAGVSFGGFDISGVIYYLLNIPGLVVAYRKMRHRFVFKTLFTVTVITVLLSVIPIPETPILEDRLANSIIAGLMCGCGIGITLRMGACDGGMDLISMLLVSLKGKFSVGRINLTCNAILYGICLFLFDASTVIYSLIYSAFNSISCDKIHTQNINAQAIIITKMKDTAPMEIEIMGRLHRGITRWEARGSFTGDSETMLMVLLSKYEVNRLRGIVRRFDEKAFVIVNEGVDVDGHFLKKLT
ncbi:MAG: YitT family protein [Eubacteriales bacterium]|nr:YitT family protein [Eubacteriales bacterium]